MTCCCRPRRGQPAGRSVRQRPTPPGRRPPEDSGAGAQWSSPLWYLPATAGLAWLCFQDFIEVSIRSRGLSMLFLQCQPCSQLPALLSLAYFRSLFLSQKNKQLATTLLFLLSNHIHLTTSTNFSTIIIFFLSFGSKCDIVLISNK